MRVVSLVPSLTETLFALGLTERDIVGRTPWCVHPADCVGSVSVVGGTKTPRLHKILAQRPDLVVLDREENRRETFDALRDAGVPSWTASVRRVEDVPAMLESLGEAVGRASAGRALADALRAEVAAGPPDGAWQRGPRAVPLIWHEPLMALAPTRYGGDLLRRAGWHVPDLAGDGTGYPQVTPAELGELGVTVLLLTSEPHDFTPSEGEALADAVAGAGYPRPLSLKVDGEALTWFGARSAAGLAYFRRLAQAHADRAD